ncbi:carbohydrate sulfotransferase 11-like isoform X2 [Amphiura filiformis]|uniref:carbohydrate sulfotransferase 11-like isoform X2 n=1 Tax=Amphiura filiformis TaxID=82378 RepID=UPI003B22201B
MTAMDERGFSIPNKCRSLKYMFFACLILSALVTYVYINNVFHSHRDFLNSISPVASLLRADRKDVSSIGNINASQTASEHLNVLQYVPRKKITERPPTTELCDEECQWERRQIRYKADVNQACDLNNEARQITNWAEWVKVNELVLQSFYFSDKHKTIYCEIPKSACTGMKRVFYVMNGGKDKKVLTKMNIHPHSFRSNWRLSNEKSVKKVIERLKTYKSIMIVREPFARAVSGYQDKFDLRPNGFWKDWAKKMLRSEGKDPSLVGTRKDISGHKALVTFEEFITFTTNTSVVNKYRGDQHWMPIAEICFPCQFNYDFIIKIENMKDDVEYTLKRIGEEKLLQYMFEKGGHETKSSNSSSKEAYLSQLTPDLVAAFKDRFSKDYHAFNYSMDVLNLPQR